MGLTVLRQRNFQTCKVAIFANYTNPETGRFSSSLLQDWLAPSRLVLAPDPLRLSGAFAAAKAAAQLATAKVGMHLYSLCIYFYMISEFQEFRFTDFVQKFRKRYLKTTRCLV